MEKRVTIRDVAADVGVSISVVSYVLNNTPNVSISEKTRERVLASVKKLGYVQNKNASILRNGKSYTLGVVSYWASSLAHELFIEGIKLSAEEEGYKILIYNATKNTDIDDFISYYRDHMIDGVIILAPYEKYIKYDINKYVEIMNDLMVKFVIINESNNDYDNRFIPIEYNKSIYNATKYFIDKGIEEIVYLYNPELINQYMQQRYDAYKNIMLEHNLKPSFCPITEIDKRIHTFKAVVTDKSNAAYRLLSHAIELGIKIPDEFEVIAGNTEFYSKYLYPPLTTVRVPTKEIGKFAAKSLIRQIDGQPPLNYAQQNFEYKIEFRNTTKIFN